MVGELILSLTLFTNFIGVALILLFGVSKRKLVELISIASTLISFLASVLLQIVVNNNTILTIVGVPFRVDAISKIFALIVNLIGFLSTLYSIGYMHSERDYVRYYSLFILFIGSMTNLVLTDNILYLFMHWELIGLCSALLIAYWWWKEEARIAGVKAFVMTRVSDIGLAIAVACALMQGITSISQLESSIIPSFVSIAIVLSAIGKSAQFPLHTWLPDAMEGPTPVSALLHAATLVKAGVYLVLRFSNAITADTIATNLLFIALLATLFLASLAGLVAYDIKRVLAYSTVSSISIMFLAIIQKNYALAVLYFISHATFKAMLFYTAGVVEHSAHSRDMRIVHGLYHQNFKFEAITFVIGTLSAAGIPPLFAGFVKEHILEGLAGMASHTVALAVSSIASFMLALFIMRAAIITFFYGKPEKAFEHRIDWCMTIPIATLLVIVLSLPLPIANICSICVAASDIYSINAILLISTLIGMLTPILYLYKAPTTLIAESPWGKLRDFIESSLYLDKAYMALGKVFYKNFAVLASSLHTGKPSNFLLYLLIFVLVVMILAILVHIL
ncbi:MAG: proton-conducting transporter membrane subunit [Ignisphaera sp.]